MRGRSDFNNWRASLEAEPLVFIQVGADRYRCALPSFFLVQFLFLSVQVSIGYAAGLPNRAWRGVRFALPADLISVLVVVVVVVLVAVVVRGSSEVEQWTHIPQAGDSISPLAPKLMIFGSISFRKEDIEKFMEFFLKI